MKVKFAFLVGLFLAFGLSGIGFSSLPNDANPVYSETYDLYAGQNIFVGYLHVGNDTNYLYVKYELTVLGWGLTETHVDVQITPADFPMTKKGNPVVGHFAYSNVHNLETEFEYAIPNTWQPGDHVYIAAHAAVSDAGIVNYTNKVYGTTITGTKGLWEIDIAADSYINLLNTTGGARINNGSGYCNGLAYDALNNVLYFTSPYSASRAPSPMWKYEIDTDVLTQIGVLPKIVVGASFYNNRYYYITDYTDDLMMIDFSAPIVIGGDGYIVATTVFADFSPRGDVYTFGDFAISKDGMLYGSTRVAPQVFFSLNLNSLTGDYFEYLTADALDLQLAFGADGKLYGQNHGSQNWYTVDLGSGLETPIAFKNLAYADLASGMYYVARNETAWAMGTPFPGRQWAEYIGYTLTGIVPNPPGPGDWGAETAWAGKTAGGGAAWWYYFDWSIENPQNFIYAGQNLMSGASVYYNPGNQSLTITLGPDMKLNDVPENVKIQGYYDGNVPTKRPSAGLFTTFKGKIDPINNTFTINNVGNFDNYAIHMDVLAKVTP